MIKFSGRSDDEDKEKGMKRRERRRKKKEMAMRGFLSVFSFSQFCLKMKCKCIM